MLFRFANPLHLCKTVGMRSIAIAAIVIRAFLEKTGFASTIPLLK